MNVKRLLYGKHSKVVLSIILGFGLATIFRKVCKNNKCYEFVSPSLQKVKNNVWKYDNQCYKFTPNLVKCNKNKKVLKADNFSNNHY